MNTLRAWIPAPLLSILLLATWLALARSMDAAQVLIGTVLALCVPLLTIRLRPAGVRVRRPAVVVRYIVRVGLDVIVSNFAVARGVIGWQWRRPSSRFVVIPLDLRAPAGLATLALVTTIVPGTVWSELAVDRSSLLLHVWDVQDEAAFVARFKARYEQPLREIFE
jgi:multicomponent K+:H+ antiporter subunit E